MRALSGLGVVVALGASCGTDDPSSPDPCDRDPLGCAAPGGEFVIDPDCSNADTLVVVLGEEGSSGELVALSGAMAPTIHYGIQGGQHVELGFRIENPDPSHERFRAHFTIGPEAADAEDYLTTTREVIVNGADLTLTPEGGLELIGIVLFVEYETLGGDVRLVLDVEDTCGRSVRVEHAFTPDS